MIENQKKIEEVIKKLDKKIIHLETKVDLLISKLNANKIK